jgi:hypothetical protein
MNIHKLGMHPCMCTDSEQAVHSLYIYNETIHSLYIYNKAIHSLCIYHGLLSHTVITDMYAGKLEYIYIYIYIYMNNKQVSCMYMHAYVQ